MKLSTKGRYSARAMLELAMNYQKGPITLHSIAKKHDISERYLERLMAALVSAGLASSTRGQHGGFTLSREPSDIRLSEVIQTVEGSIAPTDCAENPRICKRSSYCITHDIWKKMGEAMMGVLASITLEDMVDMQKKKEKNKKVDMYYI